MPRRSSQVASRYPQRQICLKLDPDVYHELEMYCKAKGYKVNRFISDCILRYMNSLALYRPDEYDDIFHR